MRWGWSHCRSLRVSAGDASDVTPVAMTPVGDLPETLRTDRGNVSAWGANSHRAVWEHPQLCRLDTMMLCCGLI